MQFLVIYLLKNIDLQDAADTTGLALANIQHARFEVNAVQTIFLCFGNYSSGDDFRIGIPVFSRMYGIISERYPPALMMLLFVGRMAALPDS